MPETGSDGTVITAITTSHVQEYLFRSNKLAENAGASYLVETAIEDWRERVPEHRIIFIGGGRAALLFDSLSQARDAVAKWSLWLEKEHSPGLEMVVAHAEIEGSIREAYREALRKLRENEDHQAPGYDLGALSVVRACQSTAKAASRPFQDQWLSEEAYFKRRVAEDARSRHWERYKEELRASRCQFPVEIEHLGAHEGASQIAIVHADGNGIGKLFTKLTRDESLDGKTFLTRLSDLSAQVTKLANTAFKRTIGDLTKVLPALKAQGITLSPVPLKERRGLDARWYLPLRPLVDSGDDLTFICHGKLGLALAVRYLRHFHKISGEALKDYGEQTASAGVAIIPGKYPFSRGYQLSADLTGSAKRQRRQDSGPHDACYIDFQVVLEGTAGGGAATRASLYGEMESDLLQRPYRVASQTDDRRSWEHFEWLWRQFKSMPRNSAKRLMESMSRGREAMEATELTLESSGKALPREWMDRWNNARSAINPEQARADLWPQMKQAHVPWPPHNFQSIDGREYWDPLEMLDFHIEIDWFEDSGSKSEEETRAAFID